MDSKHSHNKLVEANQEEREAMCSELTDILRDACETAMKSAPSAPLHHPVVRGFLSSLRQMGHQIELWDDGDESQVWISNYGNPNSFGLMVDIDFGDEHEVYWHEPKPYTTEPRMAEGKIQKLWRHVSEGLIGMARPSRSAQGEPNGADSETAASAEEPTKKGGSVLRITSGKFEFLPEKGGWIHRKHLQVPDFALVRRPVDD